MNERMITLTLTAGETGATLSTTYQYMTVPISLTIVGVTASPNVDDAGTTIDILDDTVEVIAGVVCDTKATPGTWLSTHLGGTNAPVRVAADSVLSLDANSAAANTMVNVVLWCLVGELT
jgi:hypothetical protein